ncbi:MAG TPA: sulfotransferase [Steroidobacteraceae bacterium]|nr:sulfotransferase [Steroidobacteraceae bacterium]
MNAATLNPPAPRIEAEIGRIRALLERREFAAATAAAERLLAEVPENRDVLYLVAVGQRYLQRIDAALATLARLEQLYPEYGRLFQERGHCYLALRSAEPAIEAFSRAVHLNPALPASWKALRGLYGMMGRKADAQAAATHVATLAALPVPVVTATSMFADGELLAAEQMIRAFLLQQPEHIEGMRLLARIGMKLGVLDDAELLLEALLERAPDYRAARYDYVQVLLDRQRIQKARGELDRLLEEEPGNPAYRTAYATALVGLGEVEQGVRLYRALLAEVPAHAPPAEARSWKQHASEVHLSVAHALKTLGRTQEAIESYRAAAATRPDYGDAYWSLANLKTYRFTEEELARMRELEAAPATRVVDRFHLCFALGKALEDLGQYAESFRYYERGNALKKSQCRYQPGFMDQNAALQEQVCSAGFFAARAGVGCPSEEPIFIVGLPRSGSTLIEQILASHSQVEGTLELAEIPRLVAQLQGRESAQAAPRYPRVLADLKPEELRDFGERYLADTRVYRHGKARFIDKMPNNFRHLGLIHLILPNARIIDARREPMACCFSNFKQLFASGQEFTYSLEDIAHYYRSYVRLMTHWDAVLPGKVLRVQHEDLVADLEGNVRRILAFCGLEFEPACLEFHKTARSVRTASSEQVRQPIYREGLDQWRKFEPWLGPLKEALGELAPP